MCFIEVTLQDTGVQKGKMQHREILINEILFHPI